MKVPFLDLGAQYAGIGGEVADAIRGVFRSTSFILGPTVEDFERSFAEYVGRVHCVAVNSGTSALHLALLCAGVGPGDEVVTTPLTWISTSWAISYCGATPVFADIDPVTGNLDPEAVEGVISSRAKAIVAVDLYGNPADLSKLEALARKHGIALVDDAAQGHGARLDGRPVGSFGEVACFSFYPGKNLGAAGEGGAVVTDNAHLAARARRLRDHAQDGRHRHVEVGFNYRMDGLQGAVLGAKLPLLDSWNEARRAAAERYGRLLAGLPGLVLPEVTQEAESAWHLYVVRAPNRDELCGHLEAKGIGVGVHYPTPVHLQPAYSSLGYVPGSLPYAEAWAASCLSLPIFPEITERQQRYVAAAIEDLVGGMAR